MREFLCDNGTILYLIVVLDTRIFARDKLHRTIGIHMNEHKNGEKWIGYLVNSIYIMRIIILTLYPKSFIKFNEASVFLIICDSTLLLD